MTFKPADEAPQRGNARKSGASRTRVPRPSTRSLRKEIDGFVVFLNGIVSIVAPKDALDPIEVSALVHALDEEAKLNPRFRKGLETLLNVTSGGSLWMVTTIILARRVGRHGLVGPQLGAVIDDGGAFVLSTINAEPSEAAESMRTIMDMFAGKTSTNDDDADSPNPAT